MEYKQLWHFRSTQSLWNSFLKAKYCQISNHISKILDTGQSQAWKRLTFNKKEAKTNFQWRLQYGNCSFWWDNWFRLGPLAAHRNEGGRPGNVSVSYFWNNGQWNLQRLNESAPAHMIPLIIQTPIFFNNNLQYEVIWTPTTDGRVLAFSNPTVTRCVCFSVHSNEIVDHLFSVGNFARIVWRKFGGPVRIQTEDMPLRILLMKWWLLSSHNKVQKLILHTMPIIICWNLWKNRCSAKYGAKSSSLTRVLFSINSNINLLLRANFPEIKWPLNWQELYPFIENLQHQTISTQVVWNKPIHGFVKINSDGSELTNPGKIGAGVIIRDHNCAFIHAIAAPLGEGTNNFAEIEAALLGIQWCLNNGFTKVQW
ncbi:uncharacterized protein [Nicotiana tomentosiformis]|uniref:uncharacterized protein n=1 Tax=Nicotiana tomentosiformis TaxID=4098 RepID=UPI00051BF8E1|nr:uncharacterized protein LOC104110125 [Nicotiana tomentosiformis]